MNHSPAHITSRLLIEKGVGVLPPDVSSWPVYTNREPSAPDNVISTYTTVGTDQGRTNVDGELQSFYGIQVRVRAVDDQVGWVKSDEIRRVLSQEVRNHVITISGSRYLIACYSRIGSIIPLGNEPTSKRVLFTINAQASIEEV